MLTVYHEPYPTFPSLNVAHDYEVVYRTTSWNDNDSVCVMMFTRIYQGFAPHYDYAGTVTRRRRSLDSLVHEYICALRITFK